MSDEHEIVWLTEDRTFARLLHMGAVFSLVQYTRGGIDYEVLVETDEIEIKEGHNVDDPE